MNDIVQRAVIVFLLIVLLTGMMIHYGSVAAEDGHDPAQASARKLPEHEQHVGDRLYFWGTVVHTTDETFVVRSDEQMLTVRGVSPRGTVGDVVQMYGTLRSGATFTAERVIISKRANLRYMYGVSMVAGLLVVVVFFRQWRIRLNGLLVEPREEDD